jgi:asparagine synthase (glutamine-hydrolysing)
LSGIFGLLDPLGPSNRDVEHAAAVAGYRGDPVVRVDGEVALGAFARAGMEPGFVDNEASFGVADARVDEAPSRAAAPRVIDDDAGKLVDVLESRGAAGLDDVAADFAVAWFDRRRRILLLARDAFGMRPLFLARRGRRVGFASDPQILVAMGLASGDADRDALVSHLAGRPPGGWSSAFHGVSRVPGGRWVAFDADGRSWRGRWFRPEDVDERRDPLEHFATDLRELLVRAATSRAGGNRVALALSGGRDSGAVAIALALAGVSATSITQSFDDDLGCSESHLAEPIAREHGHGFVQVPVPSSVPAADLGRLSLEFGSPLAPPAFPLALSMADAAADVGATVLLDGEGGDLFAARPPVVLDLVRRGHLVAAARAIAAYRRGPYSAAVIVKSIGMSLLPRRLAELRERLRALPPWIGREDRERLREPDALRGSDSLAAQLLIAGSPRLDEGWERCLRLRGLDFACPILDLRVVRLILSMPPELRTPARGYKAVLAAALLGSWDADRVKAVQTPYFRRLAHSMLEEHAGIFSPDALLARRGYVDPTGLGSISRDRWLLSSLYLVGPEMWLRQRDEDGRARTPAL